MAAVFHRRRCVGLRECHDRHRSCRMAGQYELRPQQRHDREDREAGTQAPVAGSIHGELETTPLEG